MSDLFTTDEKVDFLFKKALNKPATSTSRDFFQELNITSRPYVYQEDIVSYTLPSSAPSDIQGLGDTSTDDNGRPLKGSYAGRTSSVDANIRYYHKIPLEMVAGTSGASWQAVNATQSHPGGYGDVAGTSATNYGVAASYGRVLQGSIPFNQATDGSYGVTLYKNTFVSIPFGAAGGGWLVDARPGIVTFYQFSNLSGVSETNIVYISFYRYVGSVGGTTTTQVSTMITGTLNNFTEPQVFTGGTNGSINDQSSAIQIDDRDVGELSTGELLDSIQIGGDYDGSWRFMVQKTEDGSAFLIQARSAGSWVDKGKFTTP